MPADRTDQDAEIDRYRRLMTQFLGSPGIGRRSIGVPEWDAALWRVGREWISSSPLDWNGAAEGDPRDVYLATRLYDSGGHTALIGDFVEALDGGADGRPAGSASHLLLTGLYPQRPFPLPPGIQQRIHLPASHVTLIEGPTLADRAAQIFERLHALRPVRLFLFQHPQDPLVSVCAQPETAARRILVHHADAAPSFGLHLPGVDVIDLSESAASLSRLQGLPWRQLPLTAPDPGPRPHGFRRRGALVTASSGGPHKFFGTYAPGYLETLIRVLGATGGWHVHIGAFDERQGDAVGRALEAAGVYDRFIHVPHVPWLSRALWEHDVDVYLASFPIDGARARAEVLASGTPYLHHRMGPLAHLAHDVRTEADDRAWHRLDELVAELRALDDAGALAAESARARATYERAHHPAVFAATLARLLDEPLRPAPPAVDDRRLRTLESMVRSQTASLLPRDTGPDELDAEVARLRSDVELLQRQNESQAEQVRVLRADHERQLARLRTEQDARAEVLRARYEEQARTLAAGHDAAVRELKGERDRWRQGNTWRDALRRWLLR